MSPAGGGAGGGGEVGAGGTVAPAKRSKGKPVALKGAATSGMPVGKGLEATARAARRSGIAGRVFVCARGLGGGE